MFHVAHCDSVLKHENLHEIQLSVQEFLSSFVPRRNKLRHLILTNTQQVFVHRCCDGIGQIENSMAVNGCGLQHLAYTVRSNL